MIYRHPIVILSWETGVVGGYRVGAVYDSVGDNDGVEEAEETRCGSVQDVQTRDQTRCL